MDANTALGFPADTREYGVGAEILADLGVRDVLPSIGRGTAPV